MVGYNRSLQTLLLFYFIITLIPDNKEILSMVKIITMGPKHYTNCNFGAAQLVIDPVPRKPPLGLNCVRKPK